MTSKIDTINAALNLNRHHLEGCSEERLSAIETALTAAGVTYLTPQFVQEPRADREPSLLQLLTAEVFDQDRVIAALKLAQLLQDETDEVRLSRERKLSDLGYRTLTEEDLEWSRLMFELYG